MKRDRDHAEALTVFYDGGCPLCSREIAWYQRLQPAAVINWTDVSGDGETHLPLGVSGSQALARFHVMTPDGAVQSGAAGFLALWAQLRPLRPLARLAALPPIPWLLERAYRAFLPLRPHLQHMTSRAASRSSYPRWLEQALRSNHAGETGAVAIYCGMLRVSCDVTLRSVARKHLRTEARHLRKIEKVLPPYRRSRLLALWRAAGWLTGAVPALLGARAGFATVAGVETFVDRHYRDQIERLDPAGPHADLRALLEACRQDKVRQRDEAAALLDAPPGPALRAWTVLVGWGSAQAVALARRF